MTTNPMGDLRPALPKNQAEGTTGTAFFDYQRKITLAKSSQTSNIVFLFNLVKCTPNGRHVICENLTFEQVTGLIDEIPSTVVKFSRGVSK